MAGEEGEHGPANSKDCSFEWDEQSQLYFHASSGFYHNPDAGWYYSSRDGLYYIFQDGNYVQMEFNKCDEVEGPRYAQLASDEPEQITPTACSMEDANCNEHENPPLPSEWLEETLINLYLTSYQNSEFNADGSVATSEANDIPGEGNLGTFESQTYEPISENIEENGQKPNGMLEAQDQGGEVLAADDSWNEEIWQAQYGQVLQPDDEGMLSCPVTELWDWSMFEESRRARVARLVGRLVRQSTKLHQSLPTGGSLLKTSAIREVHLDLVHVASGKVYKLRSPSARYLASLTSYDASNPTKDWGFPDLYANKRSTTSPSCSGKSNASEISEEVPKFEGFSAHHCQFTSIVSKNNYSGYRDRAAERRALHGGFGIGPGQKNLLDDGSDEDEILSEAEAFNMSFGPGSYARRIMENMGWKEGETLGKRNEGLREPLQAVGNKGNAGLGWNVS